MANQTDPVYQKIIDLENDLKKKKEVALATRDLRIKGETKVEQLTKNKEDFLKKVTDLGLDPNNLKKYIIETQEKLSKVTKTLDDVLPDENGVIKSSSGISMDINKINDLESSSSEVVVPDSVEIPELVSKPVTQTGDDLFSEFEKA